MTDEQPETENRIMRAVVQLDESLADTFMEESQGELISFDAAEEDSKLFSDVRDSLLFIQKVRSQEPTLFDASDCQTKLATIGRFEIVRELGRGGFGIVLLARDPNLNRNVALKVPLPDVLLTPGLRERFLREGQAAAALRHPNIVPIYEAADLGPMCYIVSEYCEGPSMAAWLGERNKPVEPRIAATIVRDLALALQHAHDKGIIHCDLKPGNILLENTNSSSMPPCPKITDFGMARLMESEGDFTRTGTVLGTPAYMAPEQAAGDRKAVGPATDVFALGVILYELLNGQRPFQKDSILATMHSIQNDIPTPPEDRPGSLPSGFSVVLNQCLAKKPSQRYPSAANLADDLQCILLGGSFPPQTERKHLDRPQVQRTWAILGGIGIVTVLVSFLISLASQDRGDGELATNRDATVVASQPAILQADPRTEPQENDARNRRVCKWILKNRGQVFVTHSGHRPGRLQKTADIPTGPFGIDGVNVTYVQNIGESQFQDLLALPDCTIFLFTESGLTDEQFRRLVKRKLLHLQLYNTNVTNEGLRPIREVTSLNKLVLRSRRFSDEALSHLSDLEKLTSLCLGHTNVTNEGLRHLSSLSMMRDLNLSFSSNISDQGLPHLYSLKTLKKLVLTGTQVTDDGVRELKQHLTECQVIR